MVGKWWSDHFVDKGLSQLSDSPHLMSGVRYFVFHLWFSLWAGNLIPPILGCFFVTCKLRVYWRNGSIWAQFDGTCLGCMLFKGGFRGFIFRISKIKLLGFKTCYKMPTHNPSFDFLRISYSSHSIYLVKSPPFSVMTILKNGGPRFLYGWFFLQHPGKQVAVNFHQFYP